MTDTAATGTSLTNIPAAGVTSSEGPADPRLHDLMQAFARHLHAFATEVGLTEDEWGRMMDELTADDSYTPKAIDCETTSTRRMAKD